MVQIDFVGAPSVPEPKSMDACGAEEEARKAGSPFVREKPKTLFKRSCAVVAAGIPVGKYSGGLFGAGRQAAVVGCGEPCGGCTTLD